MKSVAVRKSAIISLCGQYRYMLERNWHDGSGDPEWVVAYFGVNPSKADASIDDATVRKWMSFAAQNGFTGMLVGNPFAYRSKDVKKLALPEDPVGPDNGKALKGIIQYADVLVPCWGAIAKVPKPFRKQVYDLADLLVQEGERSNKPVKCFGYTQCGNPKHPLMLSYSTELVPFENKLSVSEV